jgi:PAS domain S-box-containing protein
MTSHAKILVADDERIILLATRRILESAGYETLEAYDGEEALQVIRDHKPDLVLLDVNMPKMDGFEVCRQVKADPALAETFIIILSGMSADSDIHADGLNLGADGYIERPIANRELLAHVQAMLRIQAAEKALRLSGQQYRQLIDQAADGIFIVAPDGKLILVNSKICEMLGYTEQELLQLNILATYPPELKNAGQQRLASLQAGEHLRFERPMLRKDGSVVLVEATAAVLDDGTMQAIIRDITERKRVEESLRESEGRYRDLFDNASLAIFQSALDGKIIGVNPEFARMFGYQSPEEFKAIVKDANTIFADPNRRAEIVRLRTENPALNKFENIYRRKDGSIFTGQLSVKSHMDADGRLQYFEGFIEDITERKQAEEALEESRLLFHLLIESLPQNIYAKDVNGRFIFANQRYCVTQGKKLDEIIGKTDLELHPPELAEKYQRDDRQVIETGQTLELEEEHQPMGKEKIYVQVIKAPLYDSKRNMAGTLGIFWDITERKRAEEAFIAERNLLRTLIDNLPDRIYVKDMLGRKTISNTADWQASGGKSVEDVLGKPDSAMYPPELAAQYLADDKAVMESGISIVNREEPGFDAHGNPVWVLSTKVALRDSQGKISGMVGIGRDITERKQAESVASALYKISNAVNTSDTLQMLFEHIYEALNDIIEAKNCFIALIDDAGEKVTFPYEVDEYSDDTPVEIALNYPQSLTVEVIRSGKPLLLSEQELNERYASGRNRLWKVKPKCWMGVPLFLGRQVIGAMAVQSYEKVDKYTEKDAMLFSVAAEQVAIAIQSKRAEEALHLRVEQLTALNTLGRVVTSVTLSIEQTLDSALKGILNAAHPDLAYLFLREGDRLILKQRLPDNSLISPEIIPEHRVGECMCGLAVAKDMPLYSRDISTDLRCTWDECKKAGIKSFAALPLRNGDEIVGVIGLAATHERDFEKDAEFLETLAGQISSGFMNARLFEKTQNYASELEQRVEARTRELREAQEQLVRQEKLAVLGQLAGGVGHELRNPLSIINNAIYFLRLVQPEADEKVQEYLGIIEAETHTADKIISDLLDFSRIRSVDVEPVVVADLVSRVLERFPVPKGVRVTLKIPKDLPRVSADPRQMMQVLGNLVVNACQAMISQRSTTDMPEGGKLVISAKLSVVDGQPLVAIAVKDTGVGIPPENMKKLFEPLFTTKAKGIGLGLAVSRKLAEANGGRIEVESESGKGSTFTLVLPALKSGY